MQKAESLPFFSIITASLNSEKTIQKTLTSLHKQSFQNFEHIIIDGKSSDNTLCILEKYNEKYNIKWVSEPDTGIADAMNKGLALARGKYIAFIHADDVLYETHTLENVYIDITSTGFPLYSYAIQQICSESKIKKTLPIQMIWWNKFRNTLPHQGAFVHREVFETIGNFNQAYQICMDYDFFYRVFNKKIPIKSIQRVVTAMGSEGISSNPEMNSLRLKEDFAVQMNNEKNIWWKGLQLLFRVFYTPYKLRVVPQIKKIYTFYKT